MDALRDLYHGSIRPEEEYRPISKAIIVERLKYAENREKLLSEIENETLRQKLMDLLDERNELFASEMEDCYVQGMRMGARLITALLGKEDE